MNLRPNKTNDGITCSEIGQQTAEQLMEVHSLKREAPSYGFGNFGTDTDSHGFPLVVEVVNFTMTGRGFFF